MDRAEQVAVAHRGWGEEDCLAGRAGLSFANGPALLSFWTVLPVPAQVRRQFLPWDRPLLPQAVAWSRRKWTGERPLDLARTLVSIPTRRDGDCARRSRNTAATRGQAVFPPRVATESLAVTQGVAAGTATRLESLFTWTEVLSRAVDLAKFRAVWPNDPPARDFAWALRLGRELMRLQATLAEGGLRTWAMWRHGRGRIARRSSVWEAYGGDRGAASGCAASPRSGASDVQAARMLAAQEPMVREETQRVVVRGDARSVAAGVAGVGRARGEGARGDFGVCLGVGGREGLTAGGVRWRRFGKRGC